ncbi:major facilitator superfamily domain-containing protein [Xylariaceae sp. FL0255]|nr:major facilitator superfamily domain-containing protein [Xylariaceae sp. FL0255]
MSSSDSSSSPSSIPLMSSSDAKPGSSTRHNPPQPAVQTIPLDDDLFDDSGDSSKQSRASSPRTSRDSKKALGPISTDKQQPPPTAALLQDHQDEQSPLLSPREAEHDPFAREHIDPPDAEDEDEFQQTKSVWYLIALTLCLGGLQVAWAAELSNGTPYLLSLGLSKSLMALVWAAGPITGTLVQPYVGMLSDSCTVSWGKRKPFVLGGAAATSFAFLFLAWIKEIIGGFLGLFGADPHSDGVKTTIIVVAVIWIYVLDVAVNTVQASIRSLIADCAPSHQQEAANAMASRAIGAGNILGYIAGGINLPRYVWFFGSTQFKDLCAIASIALCSSVIFSTSVIKERNPKLSGSPPPARPSLATFFVRIFASIQRLPPQIAKVCIVQFFAWIGFFPMLFYTSSYIGEIYVQPYLEENPNMTPAELDDLYERATRSGTKALLTFAITSLATNVLLPFFVDPTYDNAAATGQDLEPSKEQSTARKWLKKLVIPGFTLRRAWMLSHIIFAGSMFGTLLVRTIAGATVLIGLIGTTWALTLWAPWAIISAEMSRRNVLWRAQKQRMASLGRNEGSSGGSQGLGDEREPDQAGVILGIHNMAIASPQLIATLGSSLIFRIFQKPRGVPGDHSYSIVLASGGFSVLVAAFCVTRIEDNMSPPEEAIYAAVEEGEGGLDDDSAVPVNKLSIDTRRTSLERSERARSSSFGAGLEY